MEQIEMIFDRPTLDGFVQGYLRCALWSTNDVHGASLDARYSIADFDLASLDSAVKDCDQFRLDGAAHLTSPPFMLAHAAKIGHNFWLSRNGHGSGLCDMFDHHQSSGALHGLASTYGAKCVYTSYDHGVCF